MRLNKLFSQPLYNTFILPLNDIQDHISENQSNQALNEVLNLWAKINVKDWHPFPRYQNLLEILKVKDFVSLIFFQIKILNEDKENIQENTKSCKDTIETVKSFAHFLNMLETSYSDPEKAKNEILYNTGKKLGLFKDTPIQTYDCNQNKTFINPKNSQQAKMPATLKYIELINILNSFSDKRICSVALALFYKMERIDKNGVIARFIKRKEENMFTLGKIDRLITLSNEYKTEFNRLVEQLNQPEDEEEAGLSEKTYNFLNNAFTK